MTVRTSPTVPAAGAGAGRRLRVVHLITGLTIGGAERHVQSLVCLSRHDAQVLSVYRDGPIGAQLRDAGRRARSLDLERVPRPRAVLRTAAALRELRPDVVHVHLLTGQGVGIPAARLARVPVIVSTEHSIMDAEVEGRPITPGLRLLYRLWESQVHRTIAVSEATRRRLVQTWGVSPDRIEVIEIGIDADAYAFDPFARSAVRRELGIDTDGTDASATVVVGAVGRFDEVKRFPVLVTALAPWLREGDRHLVIAGTGPLLEHVAALADRYGVADRVHLPGASPDIAGVLSAMDVLVSPSRDETFGMAVVEGLLTGLPAVVGQCPALDGLDLDGRVVRLPADADAQTERGLIRDAVDALLARTATRGGRARCTEPPAQLAARYRPADRVAAVDRLYESLHGHRPDPDGGTG